ncbi:MAG: hypothetical protein M3487_08090 [Actinomycetota bacterium]|nr:hypothetical protein [Acidimicrobiia bacterium]MDQ3469709.1 hypothetical protein [Actinomycetota bacterium]
MAAPRFSPVAPLDTTRGYGSPPHIPEPWTADRPGDLDGRQPVGARLGYQGPDQGYALGLAERLRPLVCVQEGEHVDDALAAATAIGLRRASMFGRAPVIHDLRIALTIWGFFEPAPPAELVALRRQRFEGVANTVHHYDALRQIVDMVPESTLRSTPAQVAAAAPADWRSRVGA